MNGKNRAIDRLENAALFFSVASKLTLSSVSQFSALTYLEIYHSRRQSGKKLSGGRTELLPLACILVASKVRVPSHLYW